MQRYFAQEKKVDKLILYESDIHHIKNVMRYQIGDNIEVVNQEKIYICEITKLDPLELDIKSENYCNNEMNVKLTIAIALVNEQKMDLILQKLTELGAYKIIPFRAERSIVKLDSVKETKKIARWQTICKEAGEQSKRNLVPQVSSIISLDELLKSNNKMKLVCSLSNESKSISKYLTSTDDEILIAIGPEGGFTTNEEEKMFENGFLPVSLGKRVLRVETAAIYVASIINYICEE